jgi:hypothetical protein
MIDKNRTYRTRDGREVRIYAVDGSGGTAIHGAIKTCSGYWLQESWWSSGQLLTSLQSDSDLIEVRPRHKRTVWLHVFKNGSVCATEETYYVPAGRLACIKVELDFEEGDGL